MLQIGSNNCVNKYRPRIIDDLIKEKLELFPAVLIEGPKWCGKTRTGIEFSKSQLFMQNSDSIRSNLKLADTKPSLLLDGKTPRLIDEWQIAPVIWDAVRFVSDMRGLPGQFILTGSATPKDGETRHTGTGRISRILMRPMSLYESGESSGVISIADLFNDTKKSIEAKSSLTIQDLAHCIVRGGWPSSLSIAKEKSVSVSRDYIDAVIEHDVSESDGIKKSPVKVRGLLKSYARNIGTMASIETITADIRADEESLSSKTVSGYIETLKRIFVIEDLMSWSPSIRSKTTLRTTPKRLFVDPSLATAVNRMTSASILQDFEYFGFLFESLVIRDLRIYANANDGNVFHYRDKNGLEVDAVIHLNDGRWGAVEVKLGSSEIETACKHLLEFRNRVNTNKMKEPSFLAVVTGTEYGFKRDDGILIIPIGCLKQ